MRVGRKLAIADLASGEVDAATVEVDLLVHARDEHVASLRLGQVRHEQSVIAPRRDAEHARGREAAEAVGREPFTLAQRRGVARRLDAHDERPGKCAHAAPSIASSVALCEGSVHPSCLSGDAAPAPPYSGASLDHNGAHR
jgi:hypothetical protein